MQQYTFQIFNMIDDNKDAVITKQEIKQLSDDVSKAWFGIGMWLSLFQKTTIVLDYSQFILI